MFSLTRILALLMCCTYSARTHGSAQSCASRYKQCSANGTKGKATCEVGFSCEIQHHSLGLCLPTHSEANRETCSDCSCPGELVQTPGLCIPRGCSESLDCVELFHQCGGSSGEGYNCSTGFECHEYSSEYHGCTLSSPNVAFSSCTSESDCGNGNGHRYACITGGVFCAPAANKTCPSTPESTTQSSTTSTTTRIDPLLGYSDPIQEDYDLLFAGDAACSDPNNVQLLGESMARLQPVKIKRNGTTFFLYSEFLVFHGRSRVLELMVSPDFDESGANCDTESHVFIDSLEDGEGARLLLDFRTDEYDMSCEVESESIYWLQGRGLNLYHISLMWTKTRGELDLQVTAYRNLEEVWQGSCNGFPRDTLPMRIDDPILGGTYSGCDAVDNSHVRVRSLAIWSRSFEESLIELSRVPHEAADTANQLSSEFYNFTDSNCYPLDDRASDIMRIWDPEFSGNSTDEKVFRRVRDVVSVVRSEVRAKDATLSRGAIQNFTVVVEEVVRNRKRYNATQRYLLTTDLIEIASEIDISLDIDSDSTYGDRPIATMINTFDASAALMLASYDDDIDDEDGDDDDGVHIDFRYDNDEDDVHIDGYVTAFNVSTRKSPLVYPSNYSSIDDAEFYVPETIFQIGTQADLGAITFVRFADDTGFARNDTDANRTFLTSQIIAVEVNGLNASYIKSLPQDVCGLFQYSLNLYRTTVETPVPQCVFYDEENLTWSDSGCRNTSEPNGTHVRCCCSHLTSFAVLVSDGTSTGESTGSQEHVAIALSYLTYIGIGVSLACICMTFVLILSIKKLRSQLRYRILLNMISALGATQICFCFLEVSTGNDIACSTVSAMTAYFLLAFFAWQNVEAYELYHTFVIVFASPQSDKAWLRKAMAFAWLSPLVVLIPFVSVKSDHLVTRTSGGNELCWIDMRSDYKWILFGPLFASLAVSIFMFILVVRVIFKHTLSSNKQNGSQIWQKLKVVGSISAVTGVAWVVSLLLFMELTVHQDVGIAFEYIFVLAVLSQGALIFYFHCWTQESVRPVLTKAFTRGSGPSSRGTQRASRSRFQHFLASHSSNTTGSGMSGTALTDFHTGGSSAIAQPTEQESVVMDTNNPTNSEGTAKVTEISLMVSHSDSEADTDSDDAADHVLGTIAKTLYPLLPQVHDPGPGQEPHSATPLSDASRAAESDRMSLC